MQTIKVRTTQNVLIDYPIAGLFDRILAFLLDFLIWIAYFVLAFSIFGALNFLSTWLMILLYFPLFFYHLIFEIAMNGQSPGKRARALGQNGELETASAARPAAATVAINRPS